MTPDDPRHGKRAGYLAGCDQPCCTVPNSRWLKQYKLAAQRNGGRTTIDPAPVRQHLQMLQKRMTLGAIAGVTHSSASHLRKILDGQPAPMRRELAARILALKVTTPVGRHWVDATGARRRIQALAVIGYSFERVADHVETCGPFNLREIACGKRAMVRSETNACIAAAYRKLLRTPFAPRNSYERAGMIRIQQRAAAAGWVSGLAWDHIDDPAAEPVGLIHAGDEPGVYDESRVLARIAGDRTAKTRGPENVEVVRRMLAAGWTQNGIHRHTGLKAERYIERARLERAA